MTDLPNSAADPAANASTPDGETPAAPTFSMDDVRKAAQVTGRSVDEVLADASRRKIVIR